MQDKQVFDPEKISLVKLKTLKEQVQTPEDFNDNGIEGFEWTNELNLGFNLRDKLAKVNILIGVAPQFGAENSKKIVANAVFEFVFVYHIENLDQLAQQEIDKPLNVDVNLANTLASISYSTTRGLLLAKLQGTALKGFILPILDPSKLLQ